MRKDLTDITVIMDRSGSMSSIRNEAENGINSFVSAQKGLPGAALFTLVQFDTEYEFIHRGRPIEEVGSCALEPRGMTALFDAVGRAVNETGERLKATPEDQRPGLVIFVIVTDGQENSSHEFNKTQIKEMIERQQKTYGWQFTFLGANVDAFAEAAQMGVAAIASSGYAPQNAAHAFYAASNNVGRMRAASMSGGAVLNAYTDEEREAMTKPQSSTKP